jgi:hypothetical protein
MRRTILAMALVFSSSAAFAIQWPWQEIPETRFDYCRGFLATSLGAYPVQGLSRVRLWLAWNEVVKETSLDFDPNGQEYLEGRKFFNTRLEAGDSQAIIDKAGDACALGTG